MFRGESIDVGMWWRTHKSPTLNVAAFIRSSWFPCCPVWIIFVRKVPDTLPHTLCLSLTVSDWNCLELPEGFQRRHLFYLIFGFLQSSLRARHGVWTRNGLPVGLCLNQCGNLSPDMSWHEFDVIQNVGPGWLNQGSNTWWNCLNQHVLDRPAEHRFFHRMFELLFEHVASDW